MFCVPTCMFLGLCICTLLGCTLYFCFLIWAVTGLLVALITRFVGILWYGFSILYLSSCFLAISLWGLFWLRFGLLLVGCSYWIWDLVYFWFGFSFACFGDLILFDVHCLFWILGFGVPGIVWFWASWFLEIAWFLEIV